MRTFASGATRDNDDNKIDYWGFSSPYADRAYGEYMTRHRLQADGKLRASDNWKQGIPVDSYQRSLYRHVQDFKLAVEIGDLNSAIDVAQAIRFNVQGWTHEMLKPGGPLHHFLPRGGEVRQSPDIMVKSAMTGQETPLRGPEATLDAKSPEKSETPVAGSAEGRMHVYEYEGEDLPITEAYDASRPKGSPPGFVNLK